jgi:hypothetical protein
MVGKSVIRERRVWRILSCMSTPSVVTVWMIAQTAERETVTARKTMRHWREPRARPGCKSHEDSVKEVFRMPVIRRDKVRLGIARRHIGKISSCIAIDAQLPVVGPRCFSQPKGNQNFKTGSLIIAQLM